MSLPVQKESINRTWTWGTILSASQHYVVNVIEIYNRFYFLLKVCMYLRIVNIAAFYHWYPFFFQIHPYIWEQDNISNISVD